MTIVLNYFSETSSISVSDRLVTIGSKPHDDEFNKAIICLFDDAIVTITFTGLAKIEGLPSDAWIAKAILGQRYDEYPLLSFHRRPIGARHLNQALERIVHSIKVAAKDRNATREHPLDILVSGYKIEKGFYWPYGLIMQKKSRTFEMSYRLLGRPGRIIDSSQFPLTISGGWDKMEPNIIDDLRTTLNTVAALNASNSDELASTALTVALREFARKHATIGSEAMIIKHVPRDLASFVSFKPIRDHSIPFVENLFGPYRISYSPWIITPATYCASAQFISAEHEAQFGFAKQDGSRGYYKIKISGIEQDPSLPDIFYIGRHPAL